MEALTDSSRAASDPTRSRDRSNGGRRRQITVVQIDP
jgi:hypothetical protein